MVRAHRVHRPYASAGAPRATSRPLRKGRDGWQQGPQPQLWVLRGLRLLGGSGHSFIARAMAAAILCSAALTLIGVNQMQFWRARRAALASEALQRESTPQGQWFSFADDEGAGAAAGGSQARPVSPPPLRHPAPAVSQGHAGGQGQSKVQGQGQGKGRGWHRGAAGGARTVPGGSLATVEPRFDSILNLLVEGALEEVSAQTRTRRGHADPFRTPLTQGQAQGRGRKGHRGSAASRGKESKAQPKPKKPQGGSKDSSAVSVGSKTQQKPKKPQGGSKDSSTVPGNRQMAHGGAKSQPPGMPQGEHKEEQGLATPPPKPGRGRPPTKGAKENVQKPKASSKAQGSSPGRAGKEAEGGEGEGEGVGTPGQGAGSPRRGAKEEGRQQKGALQPELSGNLHLEPAMGNTSVRQAVSGTPTEYLGESSAPVLCSDQWQEHTRRHFASARFSADWRRNVREALSSASTPGSAGSTIFQNVYRGMDPRIFRKAPQALASDVAASFASRAGAGVCRGVPLREALSAAARATGAAQVWARGARGHIEEAQGNKGGKAMGFEVAEGRAEDEVEPHCASEEVGTSTPGTLLAEYGERGYLWVASVPEQLSKARQHLAEAATMARLANRTLILPRVGDSHVGAARLLPLCVYFDVDSLAQYVPWVTEDFFLRHVRGLKGAPAPNATQPSLPQPRRALHALEAVRDAGTPQTSRQGRRLHEKEQQGRQQADPRAGFRFLCILPPEEDSCAQALGEVQDPVLLFSTLLLTGGMRVPETDTGTNSSWCVVHHSGYHSARERGAASAQAQAREEQGLRALLKELGPVQLLVLFSRTWFFTLNETVRRAGLQATAYAPYLIRKAAEFVLRLQAGDLAQETAARAKGLKPGGEAGVGGPAASPGEEGRGGSRFVCLHVRLEFLVKEILKTDPFGPAMREKLLRCSRAAASLAALKQAEANASHVFLAADVSFKDLPGTALNSSVNAPRGGGAAGIEVLSDSFQYNKTEARLAEVYLSEALGVLWGASGSGSSPQGGEGKPSAVPRPVSWTLVDPRHARSDRGVQAALDKLVCARADVFLYGHKWCGGGQSFDREIEEMRQEQGLGEDTVAVFGGPVSPPPPPLARSSAPAPAPGPPTTPEKEKGSLGSKGREGEGEKGSGSKGGKGRGSALRQMPSLVPPPPDTPDLPQDSPKDSPQTSSKDSLKAHKNSSKYTPKDSLASFPPHSEAEAVAAAPLSAPALEAASKKTSKSKASPAPAPPSHTAAPAAAEVAALRAPALKGSRRGTSRAQGSPHGTPSHAQPPPATEVRAPLAAGVAPQQAGPLKGAQKRDSQGKGGAKGGGKGGLGEQRGSQSAVKAAGAPAATEASSRSTPSGGGAAGSSSGEGAGATALGPLSPPPIPAAARKAQALKSVRMRRKPTRALSRRSTDSSAFVDFA